MTKQLHLSIYEKRKHMPTHISFPSVFLPFFLNNEVNFFVVVDL